MAKTGFAALRLEQASTAFSINHGLKSKLGQKKDMRRP
jgi:hypothetical protein